VRPSSPGPCRHSVTAPSPGPACRAGRRHSGQKHASLHLQFVTCVKSVSYSTVMYSSSSAFDTPFKYLFLKAVRWIFPITVLFVILAVIRNYVEIVAWIEEVQRWEEDMRRGPFHAHNRPYLDETGKPRRNPFVVIFGDISDEEMLRSDFFCILSCWD
jgi:hypothetical protein